MLLDLCKSFGIGYGDYKISESVPTHAHTTIEIHRSCNNFVVRVGPAKKRGRHGWDKSLRLSHFKKKFIVVVSQGYYFQLIWNSKHEYLSPTIISFSPQCNVSQRRMAPINTPRPPGPALILSLLLFCCFS